MHIKGLGVLLAAVLLIAGCGKGIEPQNQSTVAVRGTGTVLAQPDIMEMTITLSNIAPTTKGAQEAVSKMVRQALLILKEGAIEDKNISTASLTFNSEYDYTNRRVLIGQKAEQQISFSIENINTDNDKVSRIIDQLIQINGIALNGIDFSVKNNTDYFVKSRELAFQKALEKANQYAELSKLKIMKVLSISEEGNPSISPLNNRLNQQVTFAEAASDAGSTIVPAGEMEITTRIVVVFLLE